MSESLLVNEMFYTLGFRLNSVKNGASGNDRTPFRNNLKQKRRWILALSQLKAPESVRIFGG